jgi:hypothetical protein
MLGGVLSHLCAAYVVSVHISIHRCTLSGSKIGQENGPRKFGRKIAPGSTCMWNNTIISMMSLKMKRSLIT